ncbi:hypothetical protein NDU88_001060 [Pleurodeles waltl]|uniref:Uncharacterized protein n=1 Tax=Pleurodeles waltl TaxID=8319 RepID=A0AAV7NBH7_PLEWA|nr:hypothetical protein NDU88_001060 [Pleurodeles waltl]
MKPSSRPSGDNVPVANKKTQSDDRDNEGPVNHSFFEVLFASLSEDLHTVKGDLSQEIKTIHMDVADQGDMVSNLEDWEISREEEFEQLQQEFIHLRDQHIDLQAYAEDLENRSRRNNVSIHRVPTCVEANNMEAFVQALFAHIMEAL